MDLKRLLTTALCIYYSVPEAQKYKDSLSEPCSHRTCQPKEIYKASYMGFGIQPGTYYIHTIFCLILYYYFAIKIIIPLIKR